MLMTQLPPSLTMDGFDQLNPHLGHMPSMHDHHQHSQNPHMLASADLDPASEFDPDLFSPVSDLPPSRPGTLKRAYTGYDEPFSDIQSNFDQGSVLDSAPAPDLSLDRDNKLLHFSQPSFPYALLDYTYRRVPIALFSQLHGMFFLAEPVWSGNGDLVCAPRELTCYRRNLFSISGSVTLPRSLRYILTDQGEQIPIVAQELDLSATESVEGNSVKIISVPWKTPVGTGPVPDDKAEKEPSSIPLDLMTGAEIDPECATIPISWKRLQFRIATANNGRRKELQQHFTIKLRVMATLSTGQRACLCEVSSGSIVVRGRSPRNFQAKREVPVGTGSISGRKSGLQRSPPNGPSLKTPPVKNETGNVTFDPAVMMSPDYFDNWKTPNGAHNGAMTALPPGDTFSMPPPAENYAQSSPEVSRKPSHRPAPAPIQLSLADEEPKKQASLSASPPNKRARVSSQTSARPSFTLTSLSEHDESADQLYEYFPLGMDDWQEPVDAVYRPHVVHHINVPDPKSKALATRSKRYFSSEEAGP